MATDLPLKTSGNLEAAEEVGYKEPTTLGGAAVAGKLLLVAARLPTRGPALMAAAVAAAAAAASGVKRPRRTRRLLHSLI